MVRKEDSYSYNHSNTVVQVDFGGPKSLSVGSK